MEKRRLDEQCGAKIDDALQSDAMQAYACVRVIDSIYPIRQPPLCCWHGQQHLLNLANQTVLLLIIDQ